MKVTAILSLIAGLLSLVSIGLMFHGFSLSSFEGGKGMAIVLFMFWGALLALVSILFGIITWMLARKRELAMPHSGKLGFGAGILSVLAILAAVAFS